ncbi:hypothetical protein [Streptomyces lydicamycinicus]|uniref:hypothetical protein n=1 Tax=Streptomyces lydicamycinicus TaxID=1546107 RepID=UPI003C30DC1B
MDPLTSLAHSVAKAGAWTARQLGGLVGDPNQVDLTNHSFLKQYAVLFAATSILVMVLWLLAIAKRAVRGAPVVVAMREAIGGLWLAVAATAFTPLILYVLIQAASAVTRVLISATGSNAGGLFKSLAEDLEAGHLPGGPLILLITGLAVILLCGALWLLLVLRALALYVGALLGVVVYAGLVDRALWQHVRRWAGAMIALVLAEPIIVVVMGLGTVLRADKGAVMTGLAITVITLGVTVALIWRVPGWGDAIKIARAGARGAGDVAGAAGRVVFGTQDATAGVLRGISAHAGRGNGGGERASRVNGTTPNSVSGGMSAHSQRTPRPRPKPPKNDDK